MARYCIFIILYFVNLVTAQQLPPHNEITPQCVELTGRIIWPHDASYDKARLISNFYTSKKKFPRVIVYCQNTQDVQNAINWARCHKVSIRVRSGGHNHEGFSTGSNAIVIDVSEMKKIQLDKNKNLAVVQPGITGGQLYSILSKEGYTQVGGTCEDVGISGLVLTGGMGPLLRIHGLSCDNLVSLEMVDANGKIIHVTPENEYKDLFWACCGSGGGNFGVVTSLVLKVYPAKQVTWFNISWDWNQPIEQIISAWQNFFLNGNKKWFSHLDIWPKAFPSEQFKKQPIQIFGVFYGTPEEAKRELAPLWKIGRSQQTIEMVDWIKLIKLFEESTSVYITEKPEYKSSGAFAMQPLPSEAIKILVDKLERTSSPLLNVLMFSLGGAAADKSPTETAYFYRQAQSLLVYSSQWLEEKNELKHLKELDALRQQLLPYTVGDYIGNPDRHVTLEDYFRDNLPRLRCIKQKYDPQNLFQFEQGIPPATNAERCSTYQGR